jgi:hypothetical protein
MRLSGAQLAGIALVVLGAAFLLRNAGLLVVDWDVLWPLLLVVLGVVVLLGAFGSGRGDASAIRVPRGPEELELDLTGGAGRFSIRGGASDLVELASSDRDARWSTKRLGNRAVVRIRQDPSWGPWRWGRPTDWQIRLASDVPTALDVRIGAGELDLDLLDVRVVGARLSLGAASGALRLPRPVGDVRLDVRTGAASLRVGVPAGVQARVRASGGLMSLSGESETPGWATATDRVSVEVSGGASSVRVVAA